MMDRKQFIRSTGMLGALAALDPGYLFANGKADLPSMRPPVSQRKFVSDSVEQTISVVKKGIADKKLSWLFENCFPNTLDTTVDFEDRSGSPDTYVITGDIDAMWLRDSSAQVWPYLLLVKSDPKLQLLIKGVINRQVQCILLDPYANAFYKDFSRVSEWKSDLTTMKPGIHERKWEVDSLCYPIRLSYGYWQVTGDTSQFDKDWLEAMRLVVQTFRQQQRKEGPGPYAFQRNTSWATDGVPLSGYGYPVKPVGLICSIFRPSDDATIFPFLIPSNFFAARSLRQLHEILKYLKADSARQTDCFTLLQEVEEGLSKYGTVRDPRFGQVFAYEVNGFGSYNLMDDANVPSLLSLPYLIRKEFAANTTYQHTRAMLLSEDNPFFYKGTAGSGNGSPHTGVDYIWPISIIMRALTSADEREIRDCLAMLVRSNAGTGFMHESFYRNDASRFTRKWFAWANTLFGELILRLYRERPGLLTSFQTPAS